MSKALTASVVIGAALSASYNNVFKTAKQKQYELGQAFADTNKKLRASNAVVEYRHKLTALKRKYAETSGDNRRMAAGIADLEKRYRAAKRELKSYGVAVGDAVKAQQRLAKESKKLSRALESGAIRERNKALRQELHARALPVLGAAYGAGRILGGAMAVEQQEIRLQTVINAEDGDTRAAVRRAREHAIDVAHTSLASQSEILDIQYALNSAGLSEQASRAGSEIASKVATVTYGTPEQVAEIIGTTFNNMGNAVAGANVDEKLGRIGDVLTKIQFKYQLRDFGQLGESMKEAASQASISKVGLEETAVALGLLNSAGLDGGKGGTAFSATLRQIKKAADELGFSIVRGAEYGAFTDYINREIAQIIIGQTMTMDDGSSRSQAETHLKVRADLIKADARLIHDSFNRSVVRWLTDWNYPGAAYPITGRDMEEPLDLDALATRDAKIAKMMGRRPTPEYIEETYNLPLDEPVQAQPAPTDLPPPAPALAEPTDSDPKARLIDQTRSRAGPKFDGLIQAAKTALDQAESLDAYRDWLTDRAVDALDSRPVGEVLGEALTVAFLSGWTDSAENSPMFAEPSEAYLPFGEQIAFFRNKISLPTRTWTDIYETQHDVAFVVAGAAQAGLLTNLRRAVDAAITQGETLRQFRAQFDNAVGGWKYNGGRDWRTRVIYDTNLNTSYAAGRYQQMQTVKAGRPWWRYRHSEAVTEPREAHLAWDGLVLHADDPWWTTHYPPNGWGCQCYVETLSDQDLARLDKDGPDTAPDKDIQQRWVGQAAPREASVPRGIDPGFAYAPGRSTQLGHAVQHALRGTLKQQPDIASRNIAKTLADVPNAKEELLKDWQGWVKAADLSKPDKLDAFDVGVLPVEVIRALRQRPDPVEVSASLVTITQAQLSHLLRDSKQARGVALSMEDIKRLPDIIAKPEAVLWDKEEPGLLFAFNAPDKKAGKFFLRVEFAAQIKIAPAKKQRLTTNAVRSAGYVEKRMLKMKRYQLVKGKL